MIVAVREQQEQAAPQNKVRQAPKVTARLAEALSNSDCDPTASNQEDHSRSGGSNQFQPII